MTRLMVGIDPGVNTGVAVWDREARKLVAVQSMGMFQAHIYILALQSPWGVVYEDARLRTWFGLKGREALQGAGSIKRDCQLWADWLGMHNLPYLQVSPRAKGAKLDADAFRRVTGWTERTNEHGRDAAMLVFGR